MNAVLKERISTLRDPLSTLFCFFFVVFFFKLHESEFDEISELEGVSTN